MMLRFDYECQECRNSQELFLPRKEIKDEIELECLQCSKKTKHSKLFNTFNLSTKNLPTVGQASFKKDMIKKRTKASSRHQERVSAGQGITRVSDLSNKNSKGF